MVIVKYIILSVDQKENVYIKLKITRMFFFRFLGRSIANVIR